MGGTAPQATWQRTRRKRAAARLIRTTGCDLRVMRIVGGQYALRVSPAGVLRARRAMASRALAGAGWVEGSALIVGRPPFVGAIEAAVRELEASPGNLREAIVIPIRPDGRAA